MKKLILTLISVIFFSNLFAQIVNEGFESYTVGQGVAEAAGSPWSTWSNAPGGAEDPVISNSTAHTGDNSAYVSGSNDGILNLNDLTSGRYRIDLYMLVETGKSGYFNVLQDFNGSNSKWGTDLFFKPDGTGSIYAGKVDAATFNYSQNTWFPVRIFIDMDNDFATAIVNGNELVSWQWSSGSTGGNSLNKLDAIDFYAWSNQGAYTPGYYFDDITFTALNTLSAPQNLVSTLTDDDVNLTWDAPAVTPDSYVLVRNGKVIASGLTATTYDDNNVYPGTYTYSVKAFYNDEGYSPSSNEVSETISGGIDRNLVLYEIGTGTWCQYCPGAAMGADDMISNGHNAAIIEYHSGDDYSNAFSSTRLSYYSVSAFPTTVVDGVEKYEGGSNSESLYPAYLNFYNNRIFRKALYSINANVTYSGGDSYNIDINSTEEYQYFTGDVKLYVAITESGIAENWQGQTRLDFVCIDMLPDADGTILNFSGNSTQNTNLDFTINSSDHNKNNCEVVVFLQDADSKEILNASKYDIGDLFVNINENRKNHINVYPNPAYDYITVESNNNYQLTISDITGKTIYSDNSFKNRRNINISEYREGIYFIKMISGNNFITKKFSIIK